MSTKGIRYCVKIGDEIRWITKNGVHIPIDSDTGDVARDQLYDDEKFQKLIGPEFKGVKGQKAIDLIAQKQGGHVKAALRREGIGDIDVIWGDDSIGLKHVVQQRRKQGIDPKPLLSNIADIVQTGDVHEGSDKFEIWKDGRMCVISKFRFGRDIRLVITAFPSRRRPSRFGK